MGTNEMGTNEIGTNNKMKYKLLVFYYKRCPNNGSPCDYPPYPGKYQV